MNATTSLDSPILRKNSVLFWCTLVVPAGIIALGINFILNPVGASTGFGIPIHDPAAFPFMWVKGVRDIFAGLVILPFLCRDGATPVGGLWPLAHRCHYSSRGAYAGSVVREARTGAPGPAGRHDAGAHSRSCRSAD